MSTEDQRRAARAARVAPRAAALSYPAAVVGEEEQPAGADPLTGDDAPEITEGGDVDATVRHDVADASSNGDVGEPLVEGDRPVVDDGKAAGEAMRRERQTRGRPGHRHGHGWLDVEAFTEHLRTARLHPLGEGQATVNVRVSAQLVKELEALRQELSVSKRDVVEALLVELVGPSTGETRR